MRHEANLVWRRLSFSFSSFQGTFVHVDVDGHHSRQARSGPCKRDWGVSKGYSMAQAAGALPKFLQLYVEIGLLPRYTVVEQTCQAGNDPGVAVRQPG